MNAKHGILLMAILVILLIFAFVGTASGKIWYVDDDGSADFTKIQEAIDAASPSDMVFVWNGTYYEGGGVSITKDKITLQGEDANTTTIHGRWTAERIVYVTGSYVNISGFTVAGSTQYGYGIYVEGNNCIISDNIIREGHEGIRLAGSENSVLSYNNASECYCGIQLHSSNNNTIENNIANSNGHYGIRLHYSSNNTIAKNIANSNPCDGIMLCDSNSNLITGNTADANCYGIRFADSSNNNITGNTADANKYGIFFISTSTNNNITENNISNNTVYGIYLDYSSDNEIYYNNFINNDKQAYDHHGFNSWDKGAAVGGNYWSDHVCHGNPSDGTETYPKIDTDVGAVDNYPFEDPNGWIQVENFIFDTGYGTYPSIFGTHTGKINPNHDVIVNRMYTYPCLGTGGHTEYVRFENESWNITATWKGYKGDWHNITFDESFTLEVGETYNYTIRTGSYPQIHHNTTLIVPDGEITCSEFIDANGKKYDNWIPAIRLE